MWVTSIIDHLDSFRVVTFAALVSSVWVIAGWLKDRGYVRTGDARKLNHATALVGGVLWFNSGDALQDRVSCHAAVIVLFSTLLMVCRWREFWLFRYPFTGYARESDRPHEGFHVWFSWAVSILGLEIVDVTFGSTDLTRCAALVLGLADAVGEPIGSRFGMHRYFVRDVLTSNPRQRSWEGSLAVACATTLIVLFSVSHPFFAESGMFDTSMFWRQIQFSLLTGLVVSVVEAWTPHGLDNLTIPIAAAIAINGLFSNSV